MKSSPANDGPRPFGQANWLRSLETDKPLETYEISIHSDASVVGEIAEGLGPYQVLNLVADAPAFGASRAIAALRIRSYLENAEPVLDSTNMSSYHGASFWDELVSLLSLALGIRLRAGGIIRDFRNDPMGSPFAELLSNRPFLMRPERNPVLFHPQSPKNWDDALTAMAEYPRLAPPAAVRLIRAARAYQNALWISDLDPNLAWLLLVSAVESVAVSLPGGPSKRFEAFLIRYLPEPPAERPTGSARLDWSSSSLRKEFRLIYRCRSLALHEALPFPWPALEPPVKHEGWDGPAERFFAISAASYGGSWLAKDIPILLSTFEFLVRGALTRWWKEAAAA